MEMIENVFDFEDEDSRDCIHEDDEIYEMIEAPKFVDLTRPDQFLSDDRSWFCARIGCDQTHEDVDPDALHKSFVLRVMAARSPNLRLRKALRSREVPSAYMKCPMSAPAKASKPRVCRFTAMASITHKRTIVKAKIHPVSKVTLTPKSKPMQSSTSAKALTTPRVRNCIPSSDQFRSVQNKKTSVAVQKSKVVAKELVFNTPKKSERNKSLSESETPLTEICVGLKKLELNSQRKITSLNSSKVLIRGLSRAKQSTTASDPSTSKLHCQKVKSRDKDSEDLKLREVNSSNYANSSRPKQLGKISISKPSTETNSDMETDGESKNGSFGICSVSGSNEGVTGTMQGECVPYDQHGNAICKISEDKGGSIHVANDAIKALTFNTPKESERGTTVLPSETPLTEICNGMNKLVINSQKPKPLSTSSKLTRCPSSRPKKVESVSDPSTSKSYSRKMKSGSKESEVCKKESKNKKTRSTNILQKLSSPTVHSVATDDVKIDREISNDNRECLEVVTAPVVATTEEECLPTLETCLIGENSVQAVLVDGLEEGPESGVSGDDSIGITEKCLIGEKHVLSGNVDDPSNIQENNMPNEENHKLQSLNEVGEKHKISSELKDSEVQNDDLVLQSSNEAVTENGPLNTDDKENTTASDDNRNSHGHNIQNENHENQPKGKASKGSSTLLGKYKKTKPTNPKPFRLRTDERGILREANLEKRHYPAPLKEISLVSRISEGNTQRRHPNEVQISKQKVKSHAQLKQEAVSHNHNKTEVDKQAPKIQPQQIKSVYKKATISSVHKGEPLTSTMTTRTQRETRTRKTTTKSFGTSCRLSIIKENSSAISRSKDTKIRIKSTISSSSKVKKPLTKSKELNFHKTRTPKCGKKSVSETIQTPKKIAAEVIVA